MTNCEKLYSLYKEKPNLSNSETMNQLNWSSVEVRKYKHRLKKRGFIEVDEDDGVILLKPYGIDAESESESFKQEAYKQLYDICIDRAENKDISTPQLIQLIQEIRLILNQIV